MRRTILPAIVIAAGLVAMAFMNDRAYNSIAHPELQDYDAARQAYESKALAAPALNGDNSALITDAVFGDEAAAKLRVTFGYTATENLARNPRKQSEIAGQLRTWSQAFDFASARIVCLDIPTDERADPVRDNIPLGVTVNGRRVPGLGADIGSDPAITAYSVMVPLYRLSDPIKQAEVNAQDRKLFGKQGHNSIIAPPLS